MFEKQIDDYLQRVTKNMGPRQGEDVKKELRSHILDSAEAIAAERNKPVDEGIVREVIAGMGSPESFAAAYPKSMTKSIVSDKVILAAGGLIAVFVILLFLALFLAGACSFLTLMPLPGVGSNAIIQTQEATSHAGAANISLDVSTVNGNIEIVESATDNIEVVFDKRNRKNDPDSIVTNTTYALEDDTLNVKATAAFADTNRRIFGLTIGSAGADVLVKVPKNSRYKLDLKTPYGKITIPELNGSSMAIDSDSGNIDINGGSYDSIVAETSYGHIKAKYEAKTASFKTDSGNIDLDSAMPAESLTARTSYGYIKASYNAKDATFQSSSGNIDLDSAMPAESLTARTSYGYIKASYNATDATFNSDSGNIILESGQTTGTLDAETSYGYVKVGLNQRPMFTIDAETSYGHIDYSPFPLVLTEHADSRIKGYTNAGNGTLALTLSSDSGNVEITD